MSCCGDSVTSQSAWTATAGSAFDTSSGDEVGRAWSRAIERTGADLLRPGSTTPQQLRQCKAFRQLLGQIERRLRKELALLGAD